MYNKSITHYIGEVSMRYKCLIVDDEEEFVIPMPMPIPIPC